MRETVLQTLTAIVIYTPYCEVSRKICNDRKQVFQMKLIIEYMLHVSVLLKSHMR